MGRKIISENCVLVKNKQTKICFDKPLFVGNNFVNRVGQRRNIYKKRGKTKNFALFRSQVSKFSITPRDFCSISSIFIFILWPSRTGFYYAFYTGTRKNARRRLKRRNETKTFLFTISLPLSAIRIRFSPWWSICIRTRSEIAAFSSWCEKSPKNWIRATFLAIAKRAIRCFARATTSCTRNLSSYVPSKLRVWEKLRLKPPVRNTRRFSFENALEKSSARNAANYFFLISLSPLYQPTTSSILSSEQRQRITWR